MARIKVRAICILVVVIALIFPNAQAFAAQISLINTQCFFYGTHCKDPSTAILIEGTIEKGDAKKFTALVWKKLYGERGSNTFPVFLRSPGGSVYEAMQIGDLIRRLMLKTVPPMSMVNDAPFCPEVERFPARAASCICASACFLMYAAGVPREVAHILLHRPYVDQRDNARLDLDSSTQLVATIRKDVDVYLTRMEIAPPYEEMMFATPSNTAVFIKHDPMRDTIAGYPSAIQEWLMAKCGTDTYGQNVMRMERETRSGGDGKSSDEWLRQNEARTACENSALNPKRITAQSEWALEVADEMASPQEAELIKGWARIFEQTYKSPNAK